MKLIDVSTPKWPNIFTMVDDEDFEELSKWKWGSRVCGMTAHVIRALPRPKGGNVFMHRQILNAPKGLVCDHIDGNGLNNQRSNLRLCTTAENTRNQRVRGGTSRFKGVVWHKRDRKWQASIKMNRSFYLGQFDTEVEAALAYNVAARKLHGQFARLNEVA